MLYNFLDTEEPIHVHCENGRGLKENKGRMVCCPVSKSKIFSIYQNEMEMPSVRSFKR